MSAFAYHDPDQVAFDFESTLRAAGRPQEWPLRTMEGGHAGRFTAWRGRSGRRYVASTFAIGDEDALCFAESVLIAVGPGRSIISVREAGPWGLEDAVTRWRDEVATAGATHIHVHLIAATDEDRSHAVADLTPVH
ncbi:MAG: hypothetical protein HEQ16_17070 [Bosea sp.]|nr:hypothetical protein [Bosea sp. (in: a-proteobacteria)]